MFIITIYAAAGLITTASVFWLTTKGVLRDDGSYEEWCSTLNPAWRGVAMGAFRCVNHNKDCEFEEDDAGGLHPRRHPSCHPTCKTFKSSRKSIGQATANRTTTKLDL